MKRFLGVNVWLAAVIVAALQSAALGYMVVDRAQLLQHGREIVLDVKPVDPRSLFRGDYVILNYGALSQLEAALLRDVPEGTQTLYVTLRQGSGAEGQREWQPLAASADYPDPVADGDVVLRADVDDRFGRHFARAGPVRVTYGIESYFVPEGEGKRLEKFIRKGEMKVIAAVAADGRAAIKGIEAEGQRVYEERVW